MMKKSFGGMKLIMPIVVASIAIIGLIFGSIFDLKFTNALYLGKNFWSEIVEYGGTIFTAMVIGAAGTLLMVYFKNRNEKNDKIWMWLSFVLGVVIAGGYWGFDTFHRHHELGALSKFYVYAPLGMALLLGLEYLVYLFIKNGDSKTYARKAVTIIIASLLVLAFTFGIKYINARPRHMWLLSIDRLDLYREWFQFSTDKSLYKTLPEYTSFNIQSWPSGHSSFACLTMLSILLVSCNKKTQGREMLFFVITLFWSILVMIGRILDGHHYLSDISTGMLIAAIFIFLTIYFAYRKQVVEK